MLVVKTFEAESADTKPAMFFTILFDLKSKAMVIYPVIAEDKILAIESYIMSPQISLDRACEFMNRHTQEIPVGTSTLLLCSRYGLKPTFHHDVVMGFLRESCKVFWEARMNMKREEAAKIALDPKVLDALKLFYGRYDTTTEFVFINTSPETTANRLASCGTVFCEVAIIEATEETDMDAILARITPVFESVPFLQKFWEESEWVPIKRMSAWLFARRLKV